MNTCPAGRSEKPAHRGLFWLWPLAILVACLLSGNHSVASIHIIPTTVEIGSKQRVGSISLRNEGNSARTFLLTPVSWQQNSSGKSLTKRTRELLVTPPRVTVKPGETRTLRVGLRRAKSKSHQLAYRVLIEQMVSPEQAAEKPKTGLNLVMNFSVPIFIEPQVAAKKRRPVGASYDRHRRQLVIDNSQGTRALRYRAINIVDDRKRIHWNGIAGVVLPGHKRSFTGLPAISSGNLRLAITNIETNRVEFYPL